MTPSQMFAPTLLPCCQRSEGQIRSAEILLAAWTERRLRTDRRMRASRPTADPAADPTADPAADPAAVTATTGGAAERVSAQGPWAPGIQTATPQRARSKVRRGSPQRAQPVGSCLGSIQIPLRSRSDPTSIPHRSCLDSASIPLRSHLDLTSILLGFHLDPT